MTSTQATTDAPAASPASIDRRGHRGPLVAANLALLGLIIGLNVGPAGTAPAAARSTAQSSGQPAGPSAGGPLRARGDYTVVVGRAAGTSALYILDGSNQEMIALRWDNTKQSLMGIGYRSLATDVTSPPAGR